ncbi:hypothetical protein FHS96_005895 [Sphingomonas zeicaulis]|uniref:hypothetical protein n=1 Tax=Sphingomonas zeicaulis TaxID=1632740 RepID=UPI003D246FCB
MLAPEIRETLVHMIVGPAGGDEAAWRALSGVGGKGSSGSSIRCCRLRCLLNLICLVIRCLAFGGFSPPVYAADKTGAAPGATCPKILVIMTDAASVGLVAKNHTSQCHVAIPVSAEPRL